LRAECWFMENSRADVSLKTESLWSERCIKTANRGCVNAIVSDWISLFHVFWALGQALQEKLSFFCHTCQLSAQMCNQSSHLAVISGDVRGEACPQRNDHGNAFNGHIKDLVAVATLDDSPVHRHGHAV